MKEETKDIAYYKTPIGIAKITGDAHGIISIAVTDEVSDFTESIPEALQECVRQLDEYFQKKRTIFNLKLHPQGTVFQRSVWSELQRIPYAKTITYMEQSKKMNAPKAIRAIAAANGKNPIWIVIPCHRVIGSDGSLTGYAGGIWQKKWLLEHENPSKQTTLF